MSDPIVFISTHGIKEGKLEEYKQYFKHGSKDIESEKPETVAFLAYLNEDETEVSTVHVFPDSDAMDTHMEGVDERSEGAAEFLEFRKFEIYGTPSDDVTAMMEQAASAAGATVTVRPALVGGYLRLESSQNPA